MRKIYNVGFTAEELWAVLQAFESSIPTMEERNKFEKSAGEKLANAFQKTRKG